MTPAQKTTLSNLEIINVSNAPAALGPYSQAIRANGFIFVSGQIGIDPHTGMLCEGVEAQTHQALHNIKAILASCEKELHDAVKVTVFLKHVHDTARINEIYAAYFGDHRPARSCIGVAELPRNAEIEIEVIVY